MGRASKGVAFVWIALSIALAVLAWIDYDPQFRLYFSNVQQTASSLIAALLCFRTWAAFPPGSPLSRAWGLIGAGVLAWGIGATIFGAYPILHGGQDTPYPYFSDIGYLATSPLISAGLLSFRRSAGLATPAWGWALALALLIGCGYWTFLANREGLTGGDVATQLSSVGYTLFDPILLAVTVLLATAFRGGVIGRAWWYVVWGVLLYIVANQLYTYLVLSERYVTGSWIDIGWMLGFGLIAWAAATTRQMLR